MSPQLDGLIGLTLYMVALINPISKVFILSTMAKRGCLREVFMVSVKSTLVAFAILMASALAGNFILHEVFHVEVYSLKVAGGIVIFYMGFRALTKGVFFEAKENGSIADMSIVPLASPLIAGPATITAAISMPAEYGIAATSLAIILGLSINLAIMSFSKTIGKFLNVHNFMGALIRITGLIVATIAVQMVLGGLESWIKLILQAILSD
ncbi:MAG: MarC family protein [Candidatus Altiarchaeota archaeon]